ncbi:metalloregulator ArsR/SmtB family transcription factor [Neptunicella marina]|uniref:Metalloregulator ArsR/SmtB family transcription factor n=1 Tax=Neptunicella marina TaxID=2125989 RepID=A0A8J6IV55_9ALTE|nr:metalloregulator ArsR/SmtB family transcription factor [Neptunicella marina]MBC3766218.1 metalloregulator ArsR/SmtB family transcription factor [Neptunicella marina]
MSPLNLFKLLADDTRLKSMLLVASKGQLCVCDLQNALDISQPKVSRHLADLRKAGLLQDERRGKWVYYQLASDMPDWVNQLLSHTLNHNADVIQPNLDLLNQHLNACCEN